jgi:hypothetical protein
MWQEGCVFVCSGLRFGGLACCGILAASGDALGLSEYGLVELPVV